MLGHCCAVAYHSKDLALLTGFVRVGQHMTCDSVRRLYLSLSLSQPFAFETLSAKLREIIESS
jgi:hypothetical protein